MPLSAASPCSAGVGRTGVFITLSIVLERMRYEGVVDIFQTVKMLRTQRPAMVQTEVRPCHRASVSPLSVGALQHPPRLEGDWSALDTSRLKPRAEQGPPERAQRAHPSPRPSKSVARPGPCCSQSKVTLLPGWRSEACSGKGPPATSSDSPVSGQTELGS